MTKQVEFQLQYNAHKYLFFLHITTAHSTLDCIKFALKKLIKIYVKLYSMHQFGHINFTSKNLEIRQNDIERITLHRINTNFFHALYKSIFCHKLNFFQ